MVVRWRVQGAGFRVALLVSFGASSGKTYNRSPPAGLHTSAIMMLGARVIRVFVSV